MCLGAKKRALPDFFAPLESTPHRDSKRIREWHVRISDTRQEPQAFIIISEHGEA